MYDYKNKVKNVQSLNQYTLIKTLSMFNYFNLPDTLNAVFIEKQLQNKGYVFITEVEGNLYAFDGGLGGIPDVYGEPTEININNPALSFNKTLNLKNDGVLLKNNDMLLGLYPIVERHNTLLIENEITMYLANYNARIQTLISAGDENTKVSAEKYLEKIIAGELGVIGENRLFDGLNAQNTTSNGSTDITKMIEFNQYIKASLYNELGLNANFNMKRERLNQSEVEMNTDNLYPLIDNMYTSRLQGIELVNEKYGTEIEIDFGSIWKNKSSDGTKILEGEKLDQNIPSEKFEPDTQLELQLDEPNTNHDEPDTNHDEPDVNHDETKGDDESEVSTVDNEPEQSIQ